MYPRGRTLGGSSSVNGMIWVRGQSDDFDGWAEGLGDDRWRAARCLPRFEEVERELGVSHRPRCDMEIHDAGVRAFLSAAGEVGVRHTGHDDGPSISKKAKSAAPWSSGPGPARYSMNCMTPRDSSNCFPTSPGVYPSETASPTQRGRDTFLRPNELPRKDPLLLEARKTLFTFGFAPEGILARSREKEEAER